MSFQEALSHVPCARDESFAPGAFKAPEVTEHEGPESRVFLSERAQAVEGPRLDELAGMADVPAKDRQNARPLCTLPVEEGKGPNDLQAHLPPVAVGQSADEETLVRLDPPGLIMGEFLQEIQRTLGDERVLVSREGGHFSHALRS